MDRFPDLTEDDDLDSARVLLEHADGAHDYEQGSAYALKAIAHTLLWQADQQRNWQRQVADAARKADEWRAAQPPPPPPMPGYQGF